MSRLFKARYCHYKKDKCCSSPYISSSEGRKGLTTEFLKKVCPWLRELARGQMQPGRGITQPRTLLFEGLCMYAGAFRECSMEDELPPFHSVCLAWPFFEKEI